MEQIKIRMRAFSPFGIFISLLLVFMTVLTMGGFLRVYNLVASYEKSVPDNALNEILELVKADNWSKLIDLSHTEISPFETEKDVKRFFSQIKKDQLRAKPKKGVKLTYIITDNISPIATVRFKEIDSGKKVPFKPVELLSLELNTKVLGEYQIEVPENSIVKVNGINIEEKGVKGETITDPRGGLPSGSKYEVKKTTYKMGGLLCAPEITAEFDSRPLIKKEKGRAVNLYGVPTEENAKKAALFVETAAKAYANYVSNDLKFGSIKEFFLPDTDTYSNISTFYNGWYIPHDGFLFEDLAVSKFLELGGGALNCDIVFNYVVTKDSKRYVYPSNYHICLAKTEKGYLISSLTIN
ncbi:MAG: hypothetical protein RRY40_01780 [Oscillospiraceae bacterium]